MPTVMNNHREIRLPLSYRIFSLVAVFLLALTVASTFFAFAHASKKKDTPSSFGFSVAGDYDKTTDTTNNLQEITKLSNGGQIAFHLGLGDFSYVNTPTKTDADAWSNYAKGNLPTNFPFEIVAGRHDVSAMSTYESDLPDHIGDVTVNCTPECVYGQQYYFDYPSSSAPLARFIIISPNQTIPGYTYNYTKGGADYKWVSSTIYDARCLNSNGNPNPNCSHPTIPWVIVGMHEYCFAIGYASCLNQDLLDMLLNENVDVILQTQKHNYQRSKQLALTPSSCKTNCCPTLNATTYNANCVANATNNLTQGQGSVIVLTGTGGASLLSIPNPSTDPKTGYFKNWQSSIWGISQFTISATQLTEQYDAVTGGTFNDSFTITASTPTPTPSPSPTSSVTPSPSPSVTPSATPGTTIAQDTFQRANQSKWGTASDGLTWGADANNLSNFAISSNTGQVTGSGSSATSYTGVLGASATNAEVVTTGSLSSFGTNTLGAVLRWTDNNDFYKAYITGTNLVISKKVGGTVTKMKSVSLSFTPTAGTYYTIDFSVVGTALTASAWPLSDSSKSVTVTTTDSSLTSGQCGVLVYLTSGTIADVTSFLATSH